ncbi:discoidin domain-containing protein [[Ruminococcus] torques]|nr:discoidin domain-containing protein [[Ruminococcus] torques]
MQIYKSPLIKKSECTIASVKNDNTKVEPPYRYVRANAQGAKSRYLRILVTDDVIGKYDNPFLCIKEIEFNKNIEENTSTYPIASSAEGNLEKCIDQDLSTVFTTENKTAGWLEYKLTDNTKLKSFSILQDVHTISEANVKVRTGTDKWKDLGTFDKGTKTFDVSEYDNIFAIRLEWAEGKAPSIYEIYTNEDEKQNTDDIGIYVEQIIDTEADSEKPKPEQPEIPDSENLAINRPVEVSGTELDRDQKDFAVDGNRETRWNSNYIKGDHASEEAWIIVDLGEETNIIESLTAEYFNLVYPTDYDVLVSADKENWITAKTIKNEPNGAAHPTDEISLDQPIIGRYVKLLFRELNSAAVGNCVGLEELTITGKRISSETELKEYMPISDIKIDKGTSQEELRKLLPLIISGKLALKDSDKILDLASLFVNWDLSEYTSAEDTILTLKGNLIGAGKATGDEISLNVIIGTGSTEPPVDPEGPTDPDTPDSGKIEQLKQELALLIETAQAKVESGKYTDETVKILKEQIIKSEALLTDNVTAEQLEQQINSIKKSINGLTEKKPT